MANILSNIDSFLDDFNPKALAVGISERFRERRLELNLSQQALADKAGVSLGTLKRFEQSGEISLKYLLMLAVAINSTEEFKLLFSKQQFSSIDELLATKSAKKRKRGRNG